MLLAGKINSYKAFWKLLTKVTHFLHTSTSEWLIKVLNLSILERQSTADFSVKLTLTECSQIASVDEVTVLTSIKITVCVAILEMLGPA